MIPRHLGVVLVGAMFSCLVGCSEDPRERESEPAGPAAAVTLDPPASAGAFAPDLWADDRGLLLTWLEPLGETREAGHRLRISELAGGSWSDPVTIAEGTDFFANWADVPAAARAADGTIYAHWLAKTGEETYAYSIFLARSTDGGATWEPVGTLNDDSTDTEHGFVSWVPEGDDLRAFWLDGRGMLDGGPMTVRTAHVGAAEGVGATELLDGRVCECCSTDAAVSAAGPYVVYRDRSETEVRDVSSVGRTPDGWSDPRPVSTGGWTIEGCPVNGPETDADGELAVAAWFTAAGGGAKVRAAFSGDGGATFGDPLTVDSEGPLGRVDAVLDGAGGALVSWLAAGGERATVNLVRLSGGALGEPMVVAETAAARASGFPRLVRRGQSVFLAWVDLQPDQPSRLRFREIPLEAVPG